MKKNTATLITLCVTLTVALISTVSLAAPFLQKDAATEAPAPVEQEVEEEPEEEAPAEEPEVDEREVYIATWGERIDAYNAGYPLAGYGSTFAAAAYDYGVDPRFAPAIARVESGSGAVCAYSYNAWGWGATNWPDWGTAIYEFTAALGSNYGSTLTYGIATTYNELNPDEWYAQVEQGMYEIWGDNSL